MLHEGDVREDGRHGRDDFGQFVLAQFVDFIEDDDDWELHSFQEGKNFLVEDGGRNAGVDNEDDEFELFGVAQIVGDHVLEVDALDFGGFGIAEAREVDEVITLVHLVDVHGLSMARFSANSSQGGLLGKLIDEGRFANVTAANNGNMGLVALGELAE